MYNNSRTFKIKVVLVLVILLAPIWAPFLHHSLMPTTKIDIVVVDKTVGPAYREHQALYWILAHNKFIPNHSGPGTGDLDGDGKYGYVSDYYGFYPTTNSSTNILDIDLDPNKIDILYLADTYGALETYGPIVNKGGNYTAGISAAEAVAIRSFAEKGGSIYGEWNILGDPTYNDTATEAIMSEVLHVNYLGYGGFFVDLANAGQYLKDLYEISSGLKWNFSGPGIVFILESPIYGKVTVVVLDNKDIQDVPVPVRLEIACVNIITQECVSEVELEMGYWFEIVEPHEDVEQLATFKLKTTASGDVKLAQYNLSSVFPALLQYDGPYKVVYCAADCTDYLGGYPPTWQLYFSGIQLFQRYNFFVDMSPMQKFFWKFYEPMIVNSLGWLSERNMMESSRSIEVWVNECKPYKVSETAGIPKGWNSQSAIMLVAQHDYEITQIGRTMPMLDSLHGNGHRLIVGV